MDNQPNIEYKTEEGTTSFECQFCEKKFQQFIPWSDKLGFSEATLEMWNRNTAICPHCFSMDRERMYRLYIEEKTDFNKSPKRVLHLGYEPNLQNWLIKMENVQYSGGYVTPESGIQLDLTNLDFPDETFDVIICSHVLDHAPDDKKAIQELHRVLKKDGWAIMQVPVTLHKKNFTQDTTKIYRKNDFFNILKKTGFTVIPVHLVHALGEQKLLNIFKYGLSSKDTIYIVSKDPAAVGFDSPQPVLSGVVEFSTEHASDTRKSSGFVEKAKKAWRKFWG